RTGAKVAEERKLDPARMKELIRNPRIYISAPSDHFLTNQQLAIKAGVLAAVSQAGLQPQQFGVSGLPARMVWSFDAANEVLSNCQGALILALTRFRVQTDSFVGPIPAPSEYNHIEGALAISRGLPTLVIAEQGMQGRGIIGMDKDRLILIVPEHAN